MDEIKIQDVKYPLGINKNFFEKKENQFIINAYGGDFFPNKSIGKIILSLIFSLVVGGIIFGLLPKEEKYWVSIIYLIIMAIIFPVWFHFSSIKTKFIFSVDGINIDSKKGTLFISKENIQNIEIQEEKNDYNGVEYLIYKIILIFKKQIHIPYTNEDKKKVTFLEEYNFQDQVGKSQTGKIFVHYIVQEINKMLELK